MALARHAFLLKFLISTALLVYCSRFIDFARLRTVSLDWIWLGLALLLALIDYVVGAMRFKALVDCVSRVNLFIHIKYYFWGGFFNSVLPSSVGGDAMRMLWLNRHNMKTKAAVTLVLAERILGVLTLILVAGLGAVMIEIPLPLQDLVADLRVWAGVAGFGAIGFGIILRKTPIIEQIILTVRTAFGRIGFARCAGIVALSVAYQIITVAITICMAKSIGLDLNLGVWLFVVPLVWLLTVIPISFGGLGVREIGLVFLLGAFGEFNEQAVMLGVLTFLINLIAGLVGGVWYIFDSSAARKS